MKKNGFIFVETIVAIVVLTSSLLLLYSSFSKILQSEKTRIYYDDISYIYRTHYINERLNKLNISSVKDNITDDKFFMMIGLETENLFNGYENNKNYISNLLNDFEVKEMIMIKENKIDNLKKCSIECSLNTSCQDYEACNNLYINLSDEMINYLKTLYIDVSCTYVLVVEYETCNKDNTSCQNYYSWVSV